MKQFLYNVLCYSLIVVCSVISVVFVSKFAVLHNFVFEQNRVNILILGDSHTQCAINDNIFKNSLNLSESADTYFYSYVKLKRLLQRNKQIDTLVLGYSNFNISNSQDVWLKSEKINNFKLPIYYFLFDENDSYDYFKINPKQIIDFSGTIIKRNFSHLLRIYKEEKINKFGIGGFLSLEKTMKKNELSNKNPNIKTNWQVSKFDIIYLKKIYELCEDSNVKLILLSTPVIENDKERASYHKHIHYWKTNLSNASYFNFTNLKIRQDHFADNSHLNSKGANNFSAILQNKLKNIKK